MLLCPLVLLLFFPALTDVPWVNEIGTILAVAVKTHALIVLVPVAGGAAFIHARPPCSFERRASRSLTC